MRDSSPKEPDPALGERLARVRADLFGEAGLPFVALFLDVPARVWSGHESGRVARADVIDRFVDLTGVSREWLESGRGPVYRDGST